MLRFLAYVLFQAPWILFFGDRTERAILGYTLALVVVITLVGVGYYQVTKMILYWIYGLPV